jgi:hypothetical protein
MHAGLSNSGEILGGESVNGRVACPSALEVVESLAYRGCTFSDFVVSNESGGSAGLAGQQTHDVRIAHGRQRVVPHG